MDNNTKIVKNQVTQYIRVCTKSKGLILIVEPMRTEKIIWPTFGCKIGQRDPIVMKLTLGMACHPSNVYTKFQIENTILERNGTYVEKSTEGYLCSKLEAFILIYDDMNKKMILTYLTVGCKYVKVTRL